jgi:hypothetical protein
MKPSSRSSSPIGATLVSSAVGFLRLLFTIAYRARSSLGLSAQAVGEGARSI